MIKVTNIPDDIILVLAMRDGQVAKVISPDKYKGSVVQRYGEHLIALGAVSDNCWPALFKTTAKMIPDFFVQLLPKGTCLTIC
jgi:hypothetical protein